MTRINQQLAAITSILNLVTSWLDNLYIAHQRLFAIKDHLPLNLQTLDDTGVSNYFCILFRLSETSFVLSHVTRDTLKFKRQPRQVKDVCLWSSSCHRHLDLILFHLCPRQNLCCAEKPYISMAAYTTPKTTRATVSHNMSIEYQIVFLPPKWCICGKPTGESWQMNTYGKPTRRM